MNNGSVLFFLLLLVGLTSCSSLKLEPKQIQELEKNEEFDQAIKIEKFVAPVEPEKKVTEPVDIPRPENKPEKKKKEKEEKPAVVKAPKKNIEPKKKIQKKADVETVKSIPHLPELEDGEGFTGRRPNFDPFKPGQSAFMTVGFAGVSAGTVELRVNPHVEVNNERAYHFSTHAKTNSFFSLFYKVNDWADTYIRYRDLVPLSYALHVRESKQFREARTIFDWKDLKARFWEKQVRGEKKSEQKQEWDLIPYSQNVISAFFYVRLFKFRVGKKLAFRIADNGKNMIVRLEVIDREKVATGAGVFDAHVLKVRFEYDGVFKQSGDVFIWVIDDQYQHLAKIEAKIKIGTMSLELDRISN